MPNKLVLLFCGLACGFGIASLVQPAGGRDVDRRPSDERNSYEEDRRGYANGDIRRRSDDYADNRYVDERSDRYASDGRSDQYESRSFDDRNYREVASRDSRDERYGMPDSRDSYGRHELADRHSRSVEDQGYRGQRHRDFDRQRPEFDRSQSDRRIDGRTQFHRDEYSDRSAGNDQLADRGEHRFGGQRPPHFAPPARMNPAGHERPSFGGAPWQNHQFGFASHHRGFGQNRFAGHEMQRFGRQGMWHDGPFGHGPYGHGQFGHRMAAGYGQAHFGGNGPWHSGHGGHSGHGWGRGHHGHFGHFGSFAHFHGAHHHHGWHGGHHWGHHRHGHDGHFGQMAHHHGHHGHHAWHGGHHHRFGQFGPHHARLNHQFRNHEWNRGNRGRMAAASPFQRMDANADGKITKDELTQLFDKVDINHDGAVTRDEITKMIMSSHASGSSSEKKGDADSVKPDEGRQPGRRHGGASGRHDGAPRGWAGAPVGMGPRGFGRSGTGHHRPFSADALFQRFDKNNSGKLTKSDVPSPVWDRISKADANSDGSVTKEEFEAFLKQNRPVITPPSGQSTEPKQAPKDEKPADGKPQARNPDLEIPTEIVTLEPKVAKVAATDSIDLPPASAARVSNVVTSE